MRLIDAEELERLFNAQKSNNRMVPYAPIRGHTEQKKTLLKERILLV